MIYSLAPQYVMYGSQNYLIEVSAVIKILLLLYFRNTDKIEKNKTKLKILEM